MTTKTATTPRPRRRPAPRRPVTILAHFDPEQVGEEARAESRNREVHLPPIGLYRWWARRTMAVNAALIGAAEMTLARELVIADPFAGGGVIPLAAVLRGHRVYAQDINPWATAGLAAVLGLPAEEAIREATQRLEQLVAPVVDRAYATQMTDGRPAAVSQTLRVASVACPHCSAPRRLFPHALVSLLRRRESGHQEAYLACRRGHLAVGRADQALPCPQCDLIIDPAADYTPGRVAVCADCSTACRLDELTQTPGWSWGVALVERATGRDRELVEPRAEELEIASDSLWPRRARLDAIPEGQETAVLLRHGFRDWADLYPPRQFAVMTAILDAIPSAAAGNTEVAQAMHIAVVGAAEMAGLASRWDRYYLKSYEAMAGHRFNFSTLVAEPNVWGADASRGRGTVRRRLERLAAMARWMHERTGRTVRVQRIEAAAARRAAIANSVDARVAEGSSERLVLPNGSVDLVLTDPPYHDDVQYDELSLPLRAWASLPTTHLDRSATINPALRHNTTEAAYEDLLAAIFRECRRALAADGHLVFSYANRRPEAWIALFGALDTAGFHAAGVTCVHSENETDLVKRRVRSCTLDLVMDAVPGGTQDAAPRPNPGAFPKSAEGAFLSTLAGIFCRVGRLDASWRTTARSALVGSSFLA